MRLTYKAQDQHGKETGTVWYASTVGGSIFPKSDKEEQVLKKLAAYEDAEERGLLVPVVRCGECKYWKRIRNDCFLASCELDSLVRSEDFFCADGERKDGDKNV